MKKERAERKRERAHQREKRESGEREKKRVPSPHNEVGSPGGVRKPELLKDSYSV